LQVQTTNSCAIASKLPQLQYKNSPFVLWLYYDPVFGDLEHIIIVKLV
jgi:hypothetical protein